MSKLVLINAKTYQTGVNNINDIVGVYPDTWSFTDTEKDLFDIVDVVDQKETIELIKPMTKRITKAKTLDWTDAEPEEKQVWKGSDGKYRDIIKTPKYTLCYEGGIYKETYSKFPENLTIREISK